MVLLLDYCESAVLTLILVGVRLLEWRLALGRVLLCLLLLDLADKRNQLFRKAAI